MAIRLRFFSKLSLKEIGDKLNFSKSRAQQVVNESCRLIKKVDFLLAKNNVEYDSVQELEKLNLPNYIYHILLNNEILTLDQLKKLKKEDLLKISKIGEKSVSAILKAQKEKN